MENANLQNDAAILSPDVTGDVISERENAINTEFANAKTTADVKKILKTYDKEAVNALNSMPDADYWRVINLFPNRQFSGRDTAYGNYLGKYAYQPLDATMQAAEFEKVKQRTRENNAHKFINAVLADNADARGETKAADAYKKQALYGIYGVKGAKLNDKDRENFAIENAKTSENFMKLWEMRDDIAGQGQTKESLYRGTANAIKELNLPFEIFDDKGKFYLRDKSGEIKGLIPWQELSEGEIMRGNPVRNTFDLIALAATPHLKLAQMLKLAAAGGAATSIADDALSRATSDVSVNGAGRYLQERALDTLYNTGGVMGGYALGKGLQYAGRGAGAVITNVAKFATNPHIPNLGRIVEKTPFAENLYNFRNGNRAAAEAYGINTAPRDVNVEGEKHFTDILKSQNAIKLDEQITDTFLSGETSPELLEGFSASISKATGEGGAARENIIDLIKQVADIGDVITKNAGADGQGIKSLFAERRAAIDQSYNDLSAAAKNLGFEFYEPRHFVEDLKKIWQHVDGKAYSKEITDVVDNWCNRYINGDGTAKQVNIDLLIEALRDFNKIYMNPALRRNNAGFEVIKNDLKEAVKSLRTDFIENASPRLTDGGQVKFSDGSTASTEATKKLFGEAWDRQQKMVSNFYKMRDNRGIWDNLKNTQERGDVEKKLLNFVRNGEPQYVANFLKELKETDPDFEASLEEGILTALLRDHSPQSELIKRAILDGRAALDEINQLEKNGVKFLSRSALRTIKNLENYHSKFGGAANLERLVRRRQEMNDGNPMSSSPVGRIMTMAVRTAVRNTLGTLSPNSIVERLMNAITGGRINAMQRYILAFDALSHTNKIKPFSPLEHRQRKSTFKPEDFGGLKDAQTPEPPNSPGGGNNPTPPNSPKTPEPETPRDNNGGGAMNNGDYTPPKNDNGGAANSPEPPKNPNSPRDNTPPETPTNSATAEKIDETPAKSKISPTENAEKVEPQEPQMTKQQATQEIEKLHFSVDELVNNGDIVDASYFSRKYPFSYDEACVARDRVIYNSISNDTAAQIRNEIKDNEKAINRYENGRKTKGLLNKLRERYGEEGNRITDFGKHPNDADEKGALEAFAKSKELRERNKKLNQILIRRGVELNRLGKINKLTNEIKAGGYARGIISDKEIFVDQLNNEQGQKLLAAGYTREELEQALIGNLQKERAEIEKNLRVTPLAEFGTNYAEFYHDGENAVKKVLAEKQGQVAGAFYRDEIGDIDLIWGNDGRGIQHILKRRTADFMEQGFSAPEAEKKAVEFVENDLPKLITETEKIKIDGNRAIIENDDKKAIICLDFYGKDRKWLLTAYNKYETPSRPAGSAQNANLSASNQLPSTSTGDAASIAKNSEKEQISQTARETLMGREIKIGEPIKMKPLNYRAPAVYSQNREKFAVEYAIVNQNDINPTFENAGTQARTHANANTMSDLANFDAEYHFSKEGSFDGTPIILRDGQIAVGNHRASKIKKLTPQERAEYVKEAKNKFGVDLKDGEIIVRVFRGDDAQTTRLVMASNYGRETNMAEATATGVAEFFPKIEKLKEQKRHFIDTDTTQTQALEKVAAELTGGVADKDRANLALLGFMGEKQLNGDDIITTINGIQRLNPGVAADILDIYKENAPAFWDLQNEYPDLNLGHYLTLAIESSAKYQSKTNGEILQGLSEEMRQAYDGDGVFDGVDFARKETFPSRIWGGLIRILKNSRKDPSGDLFEILRKDNFKNWFENESGYRGNLYYQGQTNPDFYDFLAYLLHEIAKRNVDAGQNLRIWIEALKNVENPKYKNGELMTKERILAENAEILKDQPELRHVLKNLKPPKTKTLSEFRQLGFSLSFLIYSALKGSLNDNSRSGEA